MDELDTFILDALHKNSRVAFLQLAEQCKVTEGTIRHRVKRLQKQGVIQQFTLRVKSDASCVVEIITAAHIPTNSISQKIKQFGVKQIYEIAGKASIICILEGKNLEEINDTVEKIRLLNGVLQTETMPILKTV